MVVRRDEAEIRSALTDTTSVEFVETRFLLKAFDPTRRRILAAFSTRSRQQRRSNQGRHSSKDSRSLWVSVPSPELGTVHLAHFSVKQYHLCNITARGDLLADESLRASNEALESTLLAKLCLGYISFVTNETLIPSQLEAGSCEAAILSQQLESLCYMRNG